LDADPDHSSSSYFEIMHSYFQISTINKSKIDKLPFLSTLMVQIQILEFDIR